MATAIVANKAVQKAVDYYSIRSSSIHRPLEAAFRGGQNRNEC